MNAQNSQQIINEVLKELQQKNEGGRMIPIGVSARHCHLRVSDMHILFGKGYELSKKAALSQPGQYAANETVTIVGPKGSIERVRILGPLRKATQVEISYTDAIKLGLDPPIRESGNIHGSSPITIVGPNGSIYLEEGLIIAQAHIHMSPTDAGNFGVQDGEYVKVEVQNELRPLIFAKVRVRVSPNYVLEMHINTDEANAGNIITGQYGRLLKAGNDND